jgi:hypothetical protein
MPSAASRKSGSYIDGLNSRRPALFNIYAVCPPEHGVGDDRSVDQSKLAVEGRAYPLFRFDPDAGTTFAECVSLEGNPSLDTDWPTYTLKYVDEAGAPSRAWTLPMTFADFAATEARFLKHFRKAPPETWNESMVPVAEFLELDKDAREGKFPFIWAVDKKNRLMRLLVTKELIKSARSACISGASCAAWPARAPRPPMRPRSRAACARNCWRRSARRWGRAVPWPGYGNRKSRRWRHGEFDGRRRRLRAGLDRVARMHGLRRMHHAGAEDFRLQRAEAGRGHQSEGLEVRRHRQGRREMHGRLHPSRHALEHERAGRGKAHGKGRQIH